MEIYQLRSFVTAAKVGHITRTAEVLHLTQPAVSGQIKALEESLGVILFDRRPGGISLTRAGEDLLPMAEQVLAAASHMDSKARELQGEVTGTMTLGTVADPDTLRLGSLLSSLLRKLPLLNIKTRSGPAEELREQVAMGMIQAAFYIGTALPGDVGGLTVQTIYYRIAAPAAIGAQVLQAGWRDIAAMPWIGAPARHHIRTLMHDTFARQGLTPHLVLESDELSLPQSLVRSGIGLSLLREDIALQGSERGELVIWPHARVPAMLSFIYPSAAVHDPAIVATLSVLRSVWSLG